MALHLWTSWRRRNRIIWTYKTKHFFPSSYLFLAIIVSFITVCILLLYYNIILLPYYLTVCVQRYWLLLYYYYYKNNKISLFSEPNGTINVCKFILRNTYFQCAPNLFEIQNWIETRASEDLFPGLIKEIYVLFS